MFDFSYHSLLFIHKLFLLKLLLDSLAENTKHIKEVEYTNMSDKLPDSKLNMVAQLGRDPGLAAPSEPTVPTGPTADNPSAGLPTVHTPETVKNAAASPGPNGQPTGVEPETIGLDNCSSLRGSGAGETNAEARDSMEDDDDVVRRLIGQHTSAPAKPSGMPNAPAGPPISRQNQDEEVFFDPLDNKRAREYDPKMQPGTPTRNFLRVAAEHFRRNHDSPPNAQKARRAYSDHEVFEKIGRLEGRLLEDERLIDETSRYVIEVESNGKARESRNETKLREMEAKMDLIQQALQQVQRNVDPQQLYSGIQLRVLSDIHDESQNEQIWEEIQKIQDRYFDASYEDEHQDMEKRIDKLEAQAPKDGAAISEAFGDLQKLIVASQASIIDLQNKFSGQPSSEGELTVENRFRGIEAMIKGLNNVVSRDLGCGAAINTRSGNDDNGLKLKKLEENIFGLKQDDESMRHSIAAIRIAIEATKCHCEHVDAHAEQIAMIQVQTNQLAEMIQEVDRKTKGSADQVGTGGLQCGGCGTQMALGGIGSNCHCSHVDALMIVKAQVDNKITDIMVDVNSLKAQRHGQMPEVREPPRPQQPPGIPGGSAPDHCRVPHQGQTFSTAPAAATLHPFLTPEAQDDMQDTGRLIFNGTHATVPSAHIRGNGNMYDNETMNGQPTGHQPQGQRTHQPTFAQQNAVGFATADDCRRAAQQAQQQQSTQYQQQPHQYPPQYTQNGTGFGQTHIQPNMPLRIGAIGAVDNWNMFDRKLAKSEFAYDGIKGGDSWKSRVRRHLLASVPAISEIFFWAERLPEEIAVTPTLLRQAIGMSMTDRQIETLEAAIWGFLSLALTGEAETIFKRSPELWGVESWRQIVRFIEHGRSIRLANLRTEMKTIHLKPIISLQKVEIGIAEFENKWKDFVEAGGRDLDDVEKKEDLLALLPYDLKKELLFRTNGPESFTTFASMIRAQCNTMLLHDKKLAIHAVEHDEQHNELQAALTSSNLDDDEINAIMRKFNPKWKNIKNNTTTITKPSITQNRRPCPNCTEVHDGPCTKPRVDISKRKCFNCNEQGHISSKCPKKQQTGNNMNLVYDNSTSEPFALCVQEVDGFQPVKRGGNQ